jgi:hypothetical protein
MTTVAPSSVDAAVLALDAVLSTQWQRVPAFVLDSPPGAGKTGVVERLAAQGFQLLNERVMIVTQTNEQAFDIARRLSEHYPSMPIHMMASKKLDLPDNVTSIPTLSIAHNGASLPQSRLVVIGNASKWAAFDQHHAIVDLQIVDEAYQLPDYVFLQIAGLAARHALIGDPGQIAPVVQAELERWRCDPAGPHVPAPKALLARHPGTLRLTLPLSRRLVADTVSLIQPAFYPDLPFQALTPVRPMGYGVPGIMPTDLPLDAPTRGQSLSMIELPGMITGEVDRGMASSMVATIRRVLQRQAYIVRPGGERVRVTPEMIGVACAQVSQVTAIRERLWPDLREVLVETANRFQGLERELMFVQHPLSGRADATAFHLDTGRLCVMLSRHSVACWLFGREGIAGQLQRYAPVGDRALGIDDDPEFLGWRSSIELLDRLKAEERIYPVPAELT